MIIRTSTMMLMIRRPEIKKSERGLFNPLSFLTKRRYTNMPWIEENGNAIYKASPFTKDALPTWNEIYHEFYKKKITKYLRDKDTELDKYYQVPRNKILVAFMCNQLNKMIFESDSSFCGKYFFELIWWNKYKDVANQKFEKDYFPTIYEISNMAYETSLFKLKDYEYKDLRDSRWDLFLSLYSLSEEKWIPDVMEEYWDVINHLLEPVIKYFENGVGWKDD